MSLLWTLLIGFVVGLLARALKPGDDSMGFILTTILGIAGAFTANFLGHTLGIYSSTQAAGFIASIIGAMILLFLASLIRRKSA